MRKGIMKKLVATALMLVTLIAIVPGATIDSKASGKDYSEYIYEDGYYMTYNELVEWAEATGKDHELVDCGTYKILDISFVDNNNKKWNQKLYSGFVGFINGGAQGDKTFNDILKNAAFNNNYLYTAVSNLKKVKEINEYVVLATSLYGAYEGYNSAKIHFEYYFTEDNNGKIYSSQKPELVTKKMLYKNNTKAYKDGGSIIVASNVFHYTKSGKAAEYVVTSDIYEENGLKFWGVTVAPNK